MTSTEFFLQIHPEFPCIPISCEGRLSCYDLKKNNNPNLKQENNFAATHGPNNCWKQFTRLLVKLGYVARCLLRQIVHPFFNKTGEVQHSWFMYPFQMGLGQIQKTECFYCLETVFFAYYWWIFCWGTYQVTYSVQKSCSVTAISMTLHQFQN